jgi:hypothetical protein
MEAFQTAQEMIDAIRRFAEDRRVAARGPRSCSSSRRSQREAVAIRRDRSCRK